MNRITTAIEIFTKYNAIYKKRYNVSLDKSDLEKIENILNFASDKQFAINFICGYFNSGIFGNLTIKNYKKEVERFNNLPFVFEPVSC